MPSSPRETSQTKMSIAKMRQHQDERQQHCRTTQANQDWDQMLFIRQNKRHTANGSLTISKHCSKKQQEKQQQEEQQESHQALQREFCERPRKLVKSFSSRKTRNKCLNSATISVSIIKRSKLLSCFIAAVVFVITHCRHFNLLPNVCSQEAPKSLPTVIVRGFLNYRTTVDGTVLLFTPDSGQQQQQSLASSVVVAPSSTQAPPTVQATSSVRLSMAPLEPEPKASAQVEPTSVHIDTLAEATASASGVLPEATPLAEHQASVADEWRPIQATPPLRLPSPGSSTQLAAAAASPGPSVQADDIGEPATSRPVANSRPEQQPSRQLAGRPARRPALGFRLEARGRTGVLNEDSLKPSALATNSSLALGSTGNGLGSINGIRRPGLALGVSVAPSGGGATSESPTAAANAFQQRLNTASTRLRNRFKHRQPPSSHAVASNASSINAVASLDAHTNGALDVASSIERPLQSLPGQANSDSTPVVGSDEVASAVLVASGAESETPHEASAGAPSDGPMSRRVGDQRPLAADSETKQLNTGSLGSAPINLDTFFQNDQPQVSPASVAPPSGEPQDHSTSNSGQRPLFRAPLATSDNGSDKNERLNTWLGQHHNKFVQRPAPSARPLNNQLLSSLDGSPKANSTFAVNTTVPIVQLVASKAENSTDSDQQASSNVTISAAAAVAPGDEQAPRELQTLTRTYTTVVSTSKTRLVPLQVKSSTAIYTVTEDYVMTKLLTAYQTMPVGEFILPEPTSAPFLVFATASVGQQQQADGKAQQSQEAPVAAAPALVSEQPIESQEQPISLDSSARNTNNWLHDFSPALNSNSDDLFDTLRGLQTGQSLSEQQLGQQLMAAAAMNRLGGAQSNFGNGGELDQLASSNQLDPAQLLVADGGHISIPDLNNPLVLAAAIQNPQLAAVILAAQQLQLKQRQHKGRPNGNAMSHQQMAPPPQQLEASFATSLVTSTRQSVYTMRDTMYTTRLVSFRDGRTVRTRTVSEPGNVIEQVLTTLVTETIPVTVAIKPTAALQLATPQATVAASAPLSSQTTINNALFATQLAQLLAKRQQQLQTSFNSAPLQQQIQTSPQQLLALQQLLGQQQQKRAGPNQQQFQPNLQQLLQSMQLGGAQSANNATQDQQVNLNQQASSTLATPPLSSLARAHSPQEASKATAAAAKPEQQQQAAAVSGARTTTLTSLQIRTYTVHNAFKTIFRTITSTVLIPTVLMQAASMMPSLG